MRKLIVLSIHLISLSVFSQDPQYSQFFNNTIYYNPATTGINSDLRFIMGYRDLWSNIPGELSTYNMSVDYRLTNKNIGLGLMFLNDNEGLHNFKTQRLEMFYSFRIEAKNRMVQFGTTVFSLNHKEIDLSNFVFSDQLDPVHGVYRQSSFVYDQNVRSIYPDWNVGIVFRENFTRNKEYFFTPTLGFSVNHIFSPNISLLGEDSRLTPKYVVHGNFLFRLMFNREYKWKRKIGLLNPGFIYENQKPFQTFTVGTGFEIYPIRLGFWFRNYDYKPVFEDYNAVIILLGTTVPLLNNHNILIDYTYDTTISSLEYTSGGAHEISLIYNISLPSKKGAVPCFREWWRLGEGLQFNKK